ncbi:hypothetical protein B0H16DRAFT_1537552 [Mycena metata]|uniref:Uncharacterized protein n=1 Tax=Mycena metata TaxID=1033252 RepID=A0AAD7NE17_9AGAR|nr:hypothetical protein B0H16DRAFT_1537552 [Mycena metata]
MSSTDEPYDYGTATFTDAPDDDSYTDSNSLEEVEATLNDLDDEIDNTISQWSSNSNSNSYTGSPSFVSLPSFASPPLANTRLSRITERTEETGSRPTSRAIFPSSPVRHSRGSTEPGLPPPGRATELIAVFEAAPGPVRTTTPGPSTSHARAASTPDAYPQGFHSTFGSRPASPTKGARVTSPGTPSSRTRPSMGTLLSGPPMSGRATSPSASTTGYSSPSTRTDTFTRTGTDTGTFTPSNTYSYSITNTNTPSNTYTNTQTTTNTNTYTTSTQTHTTTTPPASLRRPAQGSPRSPLASVRQHRRVVFFILLLFKWGDGRDGGAGEERWGECGQPPAAAAPYAGGGRGNSPRDDNGNESPSRRGSTPSLRRASAGDALLARQASVGSSLRRASGSKKGGLNVAELSAYAQSSEPPLHIGLLWFLNVHAAAPYRWQRCPPLPAPAPPFLDRAGRGTRHRRPRPRQLLRRAQQPEFGTPWGEGGCGECGGEGAEWEAVHRPLTLAESDSSSGDADESVNEDASDKDAREDKKKEEQDEATTSALARTASVRTILSIASSISVHTYRQHPQQR